MAAHRVNKTSPDKDVYRTPSVSLFTSTPTSLRVSIQANSPTLSIVKSSPRPTSHRLPSSSLSTTAAITASVEDPSPLAAHHPDALKNALVAVIVLYILLALFFLWCIVLGSCLIYRMFKYRKSGRDSQEGLTRAIKHMEIVAPATRQAPSRNRERRLVARESEETLVARTVSGVSKSSRKTARSTSGELLNSHDIEPVSYTHL